MPTSTTYKPFTVIFADASLELVPPEIRNHPQVLRVARRRGKKPSEMLLDSFWHWRAIQNLPNSYKRGRPDILHKALLLAQDSLLNRMEKLRVAFQTYDDRAFIIKREWRPPRHYLRFVGLMEQLLLYGKVPPEGEPLIEEVEGGIVGLLDTLKCDLVVGLSRRGSGKPIESILEDEVKLCFVIGAFPKGFFSEKVSQVLDVLVSLWDAPLSTLYVTARLIVTLENIILSGTKREEVERRDP